MKIKIRIRDDGQIGGFHGSVSVDGGQTWKRVPYRYIGGGQVAFDSRAQLIKYATKYAKGLAA